MIYQLSNLRHFLRKSKHQRVHFYSRLLFVLCESMKNTWTENWILIAFKIKHALISNSYPSPTPKNVISFRKLTTKM